MPTGELKAALQRLDAERAPAGEPPLKPSAFEAREHRPPACPVFMQLQHLAEFRIIHCRADSAVIRERVVARAPGRAAHIDATWLEQQDQQPQGSVLEPLTWPAPSLSVETTNGYAPTLDEVLAFVTAP